MSYLSSSGLSVAFHVHPQGLRRASFTVFDDLCHGDSSIHSSSSLGMCLESGPAQEKRHVSRICNFKLSGSCLLKNKKKLTEINEKLSFS